jgi:hypothetical protein
VVPTHKAACGHALLFLDERVTAVADLSTDWRFAKNDIRGDFKVCLTGGIGGQLGEHS